MCLKDEDLSVNVIRHCRIPQVNHECKNNVPTTELFLRIISHHVEWNISMCHTDLSGIFMCQRVSYVFFLYLLPFFFVYITEPHYVVRYFHLTPWINVYVQVSRIMQKNTFMYQRVEQVYQCVRVGK